MQLLQLADFEFDIEQMAFVQMFLYVTESLSI